MCAVADVDRDWTGYLSALHAERPGITERVPSRSHDAGIDPYDWLTQAVPPRERVLCRAAPGRR